jgi:hypothetical protein
MERRVQELGAAASEAAAVCVCVDAEVERSGDDWRVRVIRRASVPRQRRTSARLT